MPYRSPKHPHILRITTDQHSPLIWGAGGDPHACTPNLDRLAARGTTFDNHYAANPVCMPGRSCMLTGQLPRELGTPYFWDILPEGTETYPSYLARHGYHTTCVGKMHFHGKDQMHGWRFRPYGDMQVAPMEMLPDYESANDVVGSHPKQELLDFADYGGYNGYMLKTARPGEDQFMLFDKSVTREAELHLRDYFSLLIDNCYQGERPLLFEVSYKTPHCPFVCPVDLFDHYRATLPLPSKAPDPHAPPQMRARQAADQPDFATEDMIRNARAGYWGLVQWVDSQIGAVLDVLEQLGMEDDFIILYTSDHGEMVGERGLWQKTCFYEESARIPSILAGPGIPRGERVRANTSHYDLLPTLADLAGLPAPGGLRGESMLPKIGSRSPDERIVFSEYFMGAAKTSQDSAADQDNGIMAKRGDLKFIDYCDGSYELFDLDKDPDEQTNRADDPAYAADRKELAAAIGALPEPWRVQMPQWRMHRTSPTA